MNSISLVLLVIAVAAGSVGAEQCGGKGTHLSLEVGNCTESATGCTVPHSTVITMKEDFMLSQDVALIRTFGRVLTPQGIIEIFESDFENGVGGQRYSLSQDVNLSAILAGRSASFMLQIYDWSTPTDLEICSVIHVNIAG